MVAVVDTLDSIGSTAGNLPKSARVLAYLTGGDGIAWTPEQIAEANKRGETIFRIDQSNSIQRYASIATLIKDIEKGASTVGVAVAEAEQRAAIKLRTCFYCDLADWPIVRAAVRGQLPEWIDYLIADWTGSSSEAVAFITKHLRDGVIGVQYASPSSNPDMRIPGSRLTLRQANADLSVTLADWPTPKPPPSPHKPAKKVKAAGLAGAATVIVLAILNAKGSTHITHLTPAETSAITAALMALAGYLTPAKK